MSGRQSNKLPTNLPQLQNLIKRDPQSYVEEVSAVRQGMLTLLACRLTVYEFWVTSINSVLW